MCRYSSFGLNITLLLFSVLSSKSSEISRENSSLVIICPNIMKSFFLIQLYHIGVTRMKAVFSCAI